jgi:hypothetical protein
VAVRSALTKLLESDTGRYRWVAATMGSMSAAQLELASDGAPVMAIGGFNNNGGELTLAQFKAYVTAGDIHYFIGGGDGGFGPGGGSGSAAISTWVEGHFKAQSIGGSTVYDLTD